MSDRFTEQARRALYFARHEAGQCGSPLAEPEHVLVGLLEVESALLQLVTTGLQLDGASVRREMGLEPTAAEPSGPISLSPPAWSQDVRLLLERYAPEEAERAGVARVGVEHLFLGLFQLKDSRVERYLLARGLGAQAVRDRIQLARRRRTVEKPKEENRAALEDFTSDLTRAAAEGRLDPLVGRERELERVIQILARRQKNNPILLGEPGVGKTAIVEGLAQWIVSERVPAPLRDKRILALDLSLVIAGTKYRGQFEERLKGILKEIAGDGEVILFIDEVHNLVGAGSAEGSLDAASILKPALSRGQFQCIGTSTFRDFKRHIERDRSLVRRFQPVSVLPPDEEESLRILGGLRASYESYHGVTYTEEALAACVSLSHRYLADRFLPDKAVDVMDEAGARAKIRATETGDETGGATPSVGLPLVEEVVSQWTGVPSSALHEGERDKLLRIEETLHGRVIGQHEALSALARAIRRSRAGVRSPLRPIGSFVFLGPTGVGKTECAKALSEFLFGDERALVRFDMSEYMERHSAAKMIGSPPGYVGYEEGGQLVEKVRRRPYSVVLLDEIEKAHPDVLNLLLQVMEDGILTDSYGETVDFRNTILILTSNIGSRSLLERGVPGFEDGGSRVAAARKDEVLRELRQALLPEFINRLDEIIVFDALTREDHLAIAARMIRDLSRSLSAQGLALEPTREVLSFLVDRCCADRTYGARPLRRGVQRHIEDPLAEWLLKHQVRETTTLRLDVRDGAVVLVQESPVAVPYAGAS